ncbi:geranylgeranyl transferase type-2 subunit alpha [Neocloeon triangulifer]|uniref:geranylgeranyl transferase type-2 subunit alpha n=1 Tax=Neocloeon triangulifer TaxID=2078957 RepID=UPI00286F8FB7|nr:geranylgeranyl transferase type-2 subunit alpha [Neocloeon triangulifer]
MHGRLKVRTSAQEQEIKRKEREQKVKIYTAVMGKIVKKREAGELDDEMMSLTSQTLVRNPDIYTLWNIRREIFVAYKKEKNDEEMAPLVDSEVRLTESCLQVNPKSYCAWHHRGWVLDLHPSPNWKRELALCTKFLMMDERNFHCWDYRRLAAEKSGVSPIDEFNFSTEKINDNFSNYSAWHYRSKLLPLTHPDAAGKALIEPDKHRQELELVQNAAFTDPNDTSAWFYQRWLLGRDCSVAQKEPPRPLLAWLGTSRAVVSFSSAAPSPPFLRVNGANLLGKWQKASKFVWTLSLNVETIGQDCVIEVVTESGTLVLKPDSIGFVAICPESKLEGEHDPVVIAELKGQLACCRQLLDLEPDSKWTLLTLVLLMQAIDTSLYHGEMMEFLDKLLLVDPLRAGYYRDLRSKCVLEFKLSMSDWSFGAQKTLSLSDCHLSSLYFSNRLALVQEVDLSKNELLDHSLPALASLQLCVRLDLSHNKLVTLEGFPHLPALVYLNLSSNPLTGKSKVVEHNIKKAELAALKELISEDNTCGDLS